MNTSYLSLTVSMSQTTTPMSSFYSIQDGNFEIIDAFASNTAASISSLSSTLSSMYTLTGSVTLLSTNWSLSSYTLSLSVLGANDTVFLKPATIIDQSLLEAAHLFTSAATGQVFFIADTQPTSDITLHYTITKGEPYVNRGGLR